ncbi:twin-arginine translocation signal domain-containing protein [Ktedonobacter racemifer]|uniref:twin-arginine translocation signal domain-containing protein n=1 Tax=Ktedonobacter racemifer TaxID=363277 RepID=UPI0012F9DEA0|nr:twin-arginine translocation signal domain-containing protein [Ktedonobacter racemifer]
MTVDDSSPISAPSSVHRKTVSRRTFLVGTGLVGLAVAGGAGWLATQRFSSHAITSPGRGAGRLPSEIMN